METVVLSDVNIGNLDMTETNGGTTKAELSLADNQTDRDGNEVTGWHNAVCYGSTAEFVERNAQPGRRVSLSGTKNYWEYDGETYSAIDIDGIRFVDSPDESSGGFDQSSSGQSSGGNGNAGGDHFDPGEEDDDLPF